MKHNFMNAVYVRALCFNRVIYDGRDKGQKRFFVFCSPEIQNCLDKADYSVAAFHMSLLAKKMDQDVFSVANFVDFG